MSLMFVIMFVNISSLIFIYLDVDRAIMSAQTNLAALYKPTDDEVWHDNLDWQPGILKRKISSF